MVNKTLKVVCEAVVSNKSTLKTKIKYNFTISIKSNKLWFDLYVYQIL